eukprot:2675846-Ditylum_brightwellii.AAC.1
MQLALWAPHTVHLKHIINATDSAVANTYTTKEAVGKPGTVAILLLWHAFTTLPQPPFTY